MPSKKVLTSPSGYWVYAQTKIQLQGYRGPFDDFLTPALHTEYDLKIPPEKAFWKQKASEMKAHAFWCHFVALERLLKKQGPNTAPATAALVTARVNVVKYLLEEVSLI